MQYEWLYGTHVYQLSDSNPFQVKSIAGIDVAKVKPITEQGPLQDGVTDKDMRLETRTIQILMQATPSPSYAYEDAREAFNRMFTPSQQLGKLRITYNNSKVYQINARCLGDAGSMRSLEDDQQFKATVSLYCPDPLWYNPSGYTKGFGIAGGGGIFAVPTPVPTPMGASSLNQTIDLEYLGTYREFPVFLINGPITDLKIVNNATGKKIDFTGTTITSGHSYTVDLRYGRKYVYKDGVPTDIRTGETTTDSQLATWAIEANPTAPDGQNSITVTGTTITSATQIYMSYFDRYSGI